MLPTPRPLTELNVASPTVSGPGKAPTGIRLEIQPSGQRVELGGIAELLRLRSWVLVPWRRAPAARTEHLLETEEVVMRSRPLRRVAVEKRRARCPGTGRSRSRPISSRSAPTDAAVLRNTDELASRWKACICSVVGVKFSVSGRLHHEVPNSEPVPPRKAVGLPSNKLQPGPNSPPPRLRLAEVAEMPSTGERARWYAGEQGTGVLVADALVVLLHELL